MASLSRRVFSDEDWQEMAETCVVIGDVATLALGESTLADEAQRYLAAIETFRAECSDLRWLPEWELPKVPHCENCGEPTEWPQRYCDRCQT